MATVAEQIKYLENKIKTVLKPGSKTSHAMRGRLERAQKKLDGLKTKHKAEPPSKKRAKMGGKDIPTPKGSTPAFRAGEWEPTLFGKKKVKWDAGESRPNKQIEYLENKIKNVLRPGSKTSHAMRGRLERAQKKLDGLKKKHGVVAEPPAVAATAKPAPARRGETKHTIKSGDTLSALAKARGTTLGAIRRANPGRFPTAASLNKIKAGEKINMPPKVGATTPYDVKTVPVKPKKIKAKVTGIESPSHRSPVKTKTSPVKGVESPSHRSPVKKDKVKSSLSDPKFSGGVATGVRPPLKPLEGGVRYKKLPDWLGGGEIKIDSTFEEEKGDNVTHGKKGGQVKKGVKKIKARKRAALRGHRAELRGG